MIILAKRPAIFDCHILVLDQMNCRQSAPRSSHPAGREAERSELKRAFCSSLSEL
jgi:hypothetical protein